VNHDGFLFGSYLGVQSRGSKRGEAGCGIKLSEEQFPGFFFRQTHVMLVQLPLMKLDRSSCSVPNFSQPGRLDEGMILTEALPLAAFWLAEPAP